MGSSEKQLRVGVMGCAGIAMKNCRACQTSALCGVSAVASRSDQKAHDFVSEIFVGQYQPSPNVLGGEAAYDDLLAGSLCDAVYIPLPTKLHEKYVSKTLLSGKHVLLEKPVAQSASSYREMLSTASEHGKFLMDGTMFVHHPRTEKFVKSIKNPNRVCFNFTFDGGEDFFKNNIRVKKDGDFMGCIGDLGWYGVRMGLLVFSQMDSAELRKGLVQEVQVVKCQLNEEGVPIDADCLVYFSGNRLLNFHCSFMHPFTQTCSVYGTGSEYTATMSDAILPCKGDSLSMTLNKKYLIQYQEICVSEPEVIEVDNSDVQEVCMWKDFAKWAAKVEESKSQETDIENEVWWGGSSNEVKNANAIASYSLHTQIVLDALMESVRLGGSKVKV